MEKILICVSIIGFFFSGGCVVGGGNYGVVVVLGSVRVDIIRFCFEDWY